MDIKKSGGYSPNFIVCGFTSEQTVFGGDVPLSPFSQVFCDFDNLRAFCGLEVSDW
ncbi:MAG: hypothetical protein U0T77_10875 [Chitinophagales bacterium]